MDGFYAKIFNFRDIRYFDIEGEQTGLVSRAITSPCGKITIPLNESDDPKSQINEYIERYNGEGIQHIAFHTSDICKTIDFMRTHGQDFLDVPDTYYDAVDDRVMGFDEQLAELAKRGILIDGEKDEKSYLLQLFTKDCLGPVFFEIISRKGHAGFGEGNFKALFEAIERDQIRRGYLPDTKKHA
jgi:4-hydroxyphenylpyruvate dioxygenase